MEKQPVTLNCECGWRIKGNSIKHAEANLKIHRKSKLHKTLIANAHTIQKEVKQNGKPIASR